MNDREKLDKLRGRTNQKGKDIVMYSYKMSEHDHYNQHELVRLEHSISSLREFNNEIPVYLFCDDTTFIPNHFWDKYAVKLKRFQEGFNSDMLNAWSIHRWYNMKYFENKECNILYLDSDTIFYGDVQYLFDTYCYFDIYGREEFGFRYDPNTGGGSNIREQLDAVDLAIYELGGKSEVYKYCLGVVLLNNNVHKYIIKELDDLSNLMEMFKKNEIILPIPNPRIVDEYAVWVILSRLDILGGLFAVQDVSQGWKEQKHWEHFNPLLLHYTTKQEQKFAKSDEKYANLVRDVDDLGEEIDPYHVL